MSGSTSELIGFVRYIFPTARDIVLKKSLSSLDVTTSGRVLVLGSGSDPYAWLFDDCQQYVRIDIDPSSVVDVFANAEEIPFQSDLFDTVVMFEVLEHLQSPFNVVNEISRVLKPGGAIYASAPFMFHSHADPHDYQRFTSQGLHNLFHCFSSIEIVPQGNRWHVFSDLFTTMRPQLLFFPFRILNHLLWLFPGQSNKTTAPSGFLMIVRK